MIDAYGHVSVRSPDNPERFFLARHIAPEIVSSRTSSSTTSTASRSTARAATRSRALHPRRDLQARPDVMAVVHNHSPSVVPFA